MEFPVRCFSCGKVIGNKSELYKNAVIEGDQDADTFLDGLNIRRECCRLRFITFPWALREELYLNDTTNKSGGARLS